MRPKANDWPRDRFTGGAITATIGAPLQKLRPLVIVDDNGRTIAVEVFDEKDAVEELLCSGEVWYRPSVSAGKTRSLP